MHFDPPTVPVACPQCLAAEVKPLVRSFTVATLACGSCGYQWAVDLTLAPDSMRVAFGERSREFYA